MKIKLVLFIFFVSVLQLFVGSFDVFAQTAEGEQVVLTAQNPLCWKKDACNAKRAEMGATGDGWVQEDPCTGDWGKCLPASVTKTQITFGGQNSFTNAGDFIRTVYNYSMVAIQILAVIMIIIAGAQWASSAGNADAINQAKKRIMGSVIGMVIALMSYIILNTINPATVNLRLPQVWLIATDEERGVEVAKGEYCDPYGESETKKACEKSGENVCFTIGWDSELEGPCMKAAQYIVEGSTLLLGGGAGAAGKATSVIGKLASTAGGRIVKFAVNIPVKELANYSKSQIFKSAVKTMGSKVLSVNGAKWGGRAALAGVACGQVAEKTADTITCGKVVIATAEGIKEFAVEEFEDFFANHNGVCLGKAEGLQPGEMCDTEKSTQCSPPGKCVPTPGTTAIMKCWTNKAIGFCSNGANKDICSTNEDCISKKCITEQYVPQCSDGGNDSPCMENADCSGGRTCSKKSAAFTDLMGRCVGATVGYGQLCRTNFECSGSLGACYAVKGQSCLFSSLESDQSADATWGLMDLNSGVVKKGYGICAENMSFQAVGPFLGGYIMYSKSLGCGWNGTNFDTLQLCQNDSVCSSGKTCLMGGGGVGYCQ